MAMGLRPIPQYKGRINAVQWLRDPFEISDFSNECNYYSMIKASAAYFRF